MSEDKKEPELSPEEEALVGQFVNQLEGADGEIVHIVATPVGPVRITDEEAGQIRQAAVLKTIDLINREPDPLIMRIARDTFWTVTIGVMIAGGFAAVRAIVGL